MSFLHPYSYETEPRHDPAHAHDLAFISLGLIGALQFEWDWGNLVNHDTTQRHGIAPEQMENAIKNKFLFIKLIKEKKDSPEQEQRYILFSHEGIGKIMTVVFTLTTKYPRSIRPITAFYITEEEFFRILAK